MSRSAVTGSPEPSGTSESLRWNHENFPPAVVLRCQESLFLPSFSLQRYAENFSLNFQSNPSIRRARYNAAMRPDAPQEESPLHSASFRTPVGCDRKRPLISAADMDCR